MLNRPKVVSIDDSDSELDVTFSALTPGSERVWQPLEFIE